MNAAIKLRNLPIRQKLHLIIMATVCTGLTVACGAVLIYDYFVLYRSMENDLGILAEIFASNTTAALTFDDPRTAEEILSGLRAKPSIQAAIIYSSDGRVFASYGHSTNLQRDYQSPSIKAGATWSEGNQLKVLRPISRASLSALFTSSRIWEKSTNS